MKISTIILANCFPCLHLNSTLSQVIDYSWRYYRLENTGMRGDFNYRWWIAPDGNPHISGYDASIGVGGFAKFIQSENRWVNYSNDDYPAIGHPNEEGCMVVWDIVSDATGKLWMGSGRGALRFDPAVGPGSLTRFNSGNSLLVDERIFDVERTPDGTMWFTNNSCVRYDPSTDTWTQWNFSNIRLAAQPKVGGGYYVWSAEGYFGCVFQFDSATGHWIYWMPQSQGEVAGMPGQDCVDDAGNFWALRMPTNPGDWETLDYRRPDGTWVSPTPPCPSVTFDTWAFKAYGNRRAILVDGLGEVYQFSGSNWVSLGTWRSGAFSSAADIDTAGDGWVSGNGGTAKRNVQTGQWQRYRVTNTGNFDTFNRDLAIDPVNGYVYTGANAAPGVGGMVRFDGTRWTCWDRLTYGLGYDWTFPSGRVYPTVVTPDGRVWMHYGDLENFVNCGLCWYDGTNVGSFPAPPDGGPQWGGLPYAQIEDVEVREISDGYKLWMSCVSRGIAVLKVQYQLNTLENNSCNPKDFYLFQNYPNPFNPVTHIQYRIPTSSHVDSEVYNNLGQKVAILENDYQTAGYHVVVFDASQLPSGVYFCQIQAGGYK